MSLELASLILNGLILPVAGWTLKEVIALKVRDAEMVARIKALERETFGREQQDAA